MAKNPDLSTVHWISCRPIQPEDTPFLRQLFALTYADYTFLDLEVSERNALLDIQFYAHQINYTQQSSTVKLDLILLKDEPVGKCYTNIIETEIRLMEIAILPEYQNQGIGTFLLKEIQAKGTSTRLPVTLNIKHNNPAINLYRRLGFISTQTDELNYFMVWNPPNNISIHT